MSNETQTMFRWVNLQEIQFIIRLLDNDEILDDSIVGCNFDYEIFFSFTPCLNFTFYITKRDPPVLNTCDSFWRQLFNFYCIQNVLSCRNIHSQDRIKLKEKTVKKIMKWIIQKIENDKKTGTNENEHHSQLQSLLTTLMFS
jgi:hypothetical protein